MSNLEPELQALRENLLDMLALVTNQLAKCKKAISKLDAEIALEVIESEKRVNQLELYIDRDCENILALYNPVASDLRFVLSCLKISNDLERIGDNAKGFAKVLVTNLEKASIPFIEDFNLIKMLEVSISMLDEMTEAIKNEDTKLAKKAFKHDDKLDEHDKNALLIAEKLVKENPKSIESILKLFSITRRLERVGDLTKNIAEEIVFYIDAKVLKHKRNKI